MNNLNPESILDAIITGTYPFPWNKTLVRKSKQELFLGISTNVDFSQHLFGDQSLGTDLPIFPIERSTEKYFLKSFYPDDKNSFPDLTYKGKFISFISSEESYWNMDVLSDFYNEPVRLKAKREHQDKSVMECWGDRVCMKPIVEDAVRASFSDTLPFFLRKKLFEHRPEAKVFNPTWAVSILREVRGSNLAGEKWLDISAGWGDRLLSAMALGMEYLGFDPNTDLQQGHSQMIADFGSPDKHKVVYQPFETSELENNFYDVCFTSPPFFKVELYTNLPGQSVDSYNDLETWTQKFLFVSLTKAWMALKIGGHLIIYLGDTKEYKIAEKMNLFIQKLPGAKWEGVIGISGENRFRRPTWVWTKS